MIYEPVIPVPWILCIALAVLGTAVFYQLGSARRLGPGRSGFLLVTRVLALGIIVFLLFQPSREEKVPVPGPREIHHLRARRLREHGRAT